MNKIDVSIKKMDKRVKQVLIQDKSLLSFWARYFSSKNDASIFIQNCLKKLMTRRMMLRVEWYVNIADNMPKIQENRPALQIVFLIAIAESIARKRFTKEQANGLGSKKLVLDFFKYITDSDKKELNTKFKRSLTSTGYHKLYTSSIIKILYQIRNDAVHGEEYWGFSLVDKRIHKDADEPHWRLMTSGWLGTIKRKRRITLETKFTYKDLRDIFIRTAIQNIQSKF